MPQHQNRSYLNWFFFKIIWKISVFIQLTSTWQWRPSNLNISVNLLSARRWFGLVQFVSRYLLLRRKLFLHVKFDRVVTKQMNSSLTRVGGSSKLNRVTKIALTLTSSTFFLYGLGQAPIFKNFLASAMSGACPFSG